MKVLELFAGSRSIGKVADKMGFEVFSVDVKPFDNIDLIKDINELEVSDVPFIPDLVWSGTPCTTYSLAAISHHRKTDLTPITEFAKLCDNMNIRVNSFIEYWLSKNPRLIYYIENPRATLRKMSFMKKHERATVWYCKYGDHRAKPTDIFSNNIWNPMFNPEGWKPRPECSNYKYNKEGKVINKHCTHDEAMRGDKITKLRLQGHEIERLGTEGLKGNYEKSKMPVKLCEEILIQTAKKLGYETRT